MYRKDPPGYLTDPSLRLIFFGGKGGVGKTTVACASAMYLALAHPTQQILLMSTDPAHSLSDCLALPVGDRIIPFLPNLSAWEPDAPRLAKVFQAENRQVLQTLADRGTYFDETDISQFLDLSIPGIDEMMAVLEISRLLTEGIYDRIIVDTAPTGHTIRMLGLPEQMLHWVKALDLMQEKHRIMTAHFARRRPVKDECDAFLKKLFSDLVRVKAVLADEGKTRFVPVTIAEPMTIEETRRLVSELKGIMAPVSDIVVNCIIYAPECPFCRLRAGDQAIHFDVLEKKLAPCAIIPIPLFPREIQGIPGLKEMIRVLWSEKGLSIEENVVPIKVPSGVPFTFGGTPELVLVRGKGGVGKTSVAAAIALHLARSAPSSKILLFSTDPAHSLSDVLDYHIGNRITPVPADPAPRGENLNSSIQPSISNLSALEIDAEQLLQEIKQDYGEDVREIFDRFMRSGFRARLDQEIMNSLMNFAPPGLDELMSLSSIIDIKGRGDFDVLVLDTSPTGHLLRFLELPDMVRQWLYVFFRLLRRYRGVVRMTRAAEKAVNMAGGIRRIQELLTDHSRTAFVAVTLAEGMVMDELADLMIALKDARISCRHLVVNRVVPDSECSFCRSIRHGQERYLSDMESRFPDSDIILIPQFPGNIRGMAALDKLEAALFHDPCK
jgi:arsenite-transporting ATPase